MDKNIYTEEELYWRRGGKDGTLPGRITPSLVKVLADGEIFVFGSNCQGAHKELKFYVTAIGCGIAGYQPEQIAPMFLKAASLSNVSLPLSFWKVLREDASPAEEKPRRSPSEPLCRKILDALKKK